MGNLVRSTRTTSERLREGVTVTDNTRQTSDDAASAASEVLRDPSATDEEKAAAGSALSQTPSKVDPDDE
jgi:hypothetical protein